MRKYKMVEVEWMDASHYGRESSPDWIKREAHLQGVTTVGYLIQKGRKVIKIAGEHLEDGDIRDVSVIPRNDIIEIRYLEDKK